MTAATRSLPFEVARRGYRAIKRRYRALTGQARKPAPVLKSLEQMSMDSLSAAEIRAFMRHDAHRIEKAFYNQIFEKKIDYFRMRRANVRAGLEQLAGRNESVAEPTVVWAKTIADDFERLEETYIRPQSRKPEAIDVARARDFVDLISQRRSVRLWSPDQPPERELVDFAMLMIDAGRWAPCSGDRQPWKFRIMTDPAEKHLLKGLKEEHCYNAPCLIFVGMDSRFYGALGENEAGLYCDAGAAVMQMKLCGHVANYGVCWNHFCRDLLESRPQNAEIYARFAAAVGIPSHIEPVAILAFGRAASIPPVPARQRPEDLLIEATRAVP